MKAKKLAKTVAKTKMPEQEPTIASPAAELAGKSPASSVIRIARNANLAKAMPIACIVCACVALVADNVYLHVETRRQDRILQAQAEQIDGLCEWVEHASVQGKWNDGKNSVRDWGRRVAEKIRAAGRKTVSAFHKADDKLNPQVDK